MISNVDRTLPGHQALLTALYVETQPSQQLYGENTVISHNVQARNLNYKEAE